MRSKIFIGSSTEGLDLAHTIQENLEFVADVTVWNQDIVRPSRYVLEDLEEALSLFDYGIFIFSPDDTVNLRGEDKKAARDNVLFELGLFIGKLGRENCFFVIPNNVNDFHVATDLLGLVPLTYNNDRSDGNLNAMLGPACNKIKRQIRTIDEQYLEVGAKFDILNNRYPGKRALRYLDTACIFSSRSAFESCISYPTLFGSAKSIRAIGISLNSITIAWGLRELRKIIVNKKCDIQLLFLDPDGEQTKIREKEESLPPETIANVTRTSMSLARKVKNELSSESSGISELFEFRSYDRPVALNMYIIDDRFIVLQHYVYETRGQETPVLVINNENRSTGLFSLYENVFDTLWREAKK